VLGNSLFAGIALKDHIQGALGLYDRALAMERRALDHFAARAASLPAGPEQDVCRELAAEEQEHIRLLSVERARYAG
jgi:rubrerythrin